MVCPDGVTPPPYPLPSRCQGSVPPLPTDDPCCGTELAAFPDLNVTIPDGEYSTGSPYLASYDPPPGDAAWRTGGIDGSMDTKRFYMACIDGVMTAWEPGDPGTTVAATAFDCDPLLFTFPGTLWGSTADITVELV